MMAMGAFIAVRFGPIRNSFEPRYGISSGSIPALSRSLAASPNGHPQMMKRPKATTSQG